MKREEKKALTRKKILSAAIALYSERGFVEVSIEEISKAAGVGKGTVFLHYGNQDELMGRVLNQLLETFDQEMEKKNHEIRSLQEYLELHLTVLSHHEDLYFYFITQRLLLGKSVNAAYVGLQAAFSHHFKQSLEKELRLPLDVVFTSWIGMVHYYLENRDLFGGKNIIAANKEKWLSNYLSLLNEGGIKQ
ncbi:TetR/AcrR family transcriptional regulator [Enterococcus sp. BWR-S5]|uniref:TetR/AcrR family transcriptional regulator n=1 Tax=Enterococcus sp. BWR-S5 TaxID=2787714 RepID=UPI001924F042|nr:TetR/AcrR family transcriptional regulator [Enterococcus sp. BWR-S5]MBL1225316.1 TetR/AcrR family transcriptional regulator [Enterococcus sp. BWR-S5]